MNKETAIVLAETLIVKALALTTYATRKSSARAKIRKQFAELTAHPPKEEPLKGLYEQHREAMKQLLDTMP